MSNSEDIFDQIDQYLKGQLTGDSKLAFENKLTTDSEFKEFVNTQSVLRQVVIADSLGEIKAMMQSDLAQKGGSTKFRNWHKWGLGVFVLSCFLASFYYLNQVNEEVAVKDVFIKSSKERGSSNRKEISLDDTRKDDVIVSQVESVSPSIKQRNTEHVHDSLGTPPIKLEQLEEIKKEEAKEIATNRKTTRNEAPEVKEVIVNKSPCEGVKMNASFNVVLPNYPNNLGQLEIDASSVTGGVAPYFYAIDNGEFQFEESVEGVAIGKHIIHIKDGNGCISPLEEVFEIKINYCPEYIQKDFTPAFGESWSVPTLSGEDAELIISNKSGRAVCTQQYTGGQEPTWDGRSDTGAELPMGFYKFKLAYPDGGFCLGKVTIIR